MHSLFSTQIYQSKITMDLKGFVAECLKIKAADKNGQAWSKLNYIEGYTSYGSWDQLYLLSSEFEKLQKKIDTHVQKFVQGLEYEVPKKSLKMNSMWVNIMGPGAQHTAHIHPHSVISGTYYIQTPPSCSSIKFEDPRLGFFMNTPQVKSTAKKANQRFVSLQPKAGEVVLFESWLRHEVPRNESSKPRISVSFNYGWANG